MNSEEPAIDPSPFILDFLPYDIITKIFSYLEQKDCLTCMSVNRQWDNQVPQYTKNNWKTITISTRNVNIILDNNSGNILYAASGSRLSRCLGKHVKSITFQSIHEEENNGEGRELFILMQKLVDLGCDNVESLVFKGCIVNNLKLFVGLLWRMGSSRLTYLIVEDHEPLVPFFHVLQACPKLQYFKYRPYYVFYEMDYPEIAIPLPKEEEILIPATTALQLQQQPAIPTTFHNLVYLHITSVINEGYNPEKILPKCPNLQFYIGLNGSTADIHLSSSGTSYRHNFVHLGNLMSWCPKLIYVVSDGAYDPYQDHTVGLPSKVTSIAQIKKNDQQQDDESSKKQSFYHLETSEHQDYDQIVQLLHKVQDSLEYLKLSVTDIDADFRSSTVSDWSSVFRSLQLPQLRTLICNDIKYDTKSLMLLLNTCATTIQHLELQQQLYYPTLHRSTVELLNKPFPHLSYIKLCKFSFSDEHDVIALLSKLPSLEKLIICESSIGLTELAAAYMKNLKHLELWDVDAPQQPAIPVGEEDMTEEVVDARLLPVITPSFFESLVSRPCYESKLETIIMSTLPSMFSYDLLFSMMKQPNLKRLHVRFFGTLFDTRDDDKKQATLDFIQKLYDHRSTVITTSAIEDILFYNVYDIPYTLWDLLGDMPRLKKLEIKYPPVVYTKDPQVVNISGILQLLRKSSKNNQLETIRLREAASVDESLQYILDPFIRGEKEIADFMIRSDSAKKSCDLYVQNTTITCIHSNNK
ncbi:hypothetical protein BDA99DRAFT_501822 [Phascolomyces articulosus]|uniref:F-box domain-containing protein n=1 Tax=Phascolomyces articulosus TaxID=60185 RepID=A0AAD5PGI6_9FUNG|nr:hypothetical protein BDA99DRAFT_501822 [Phascolomyces articulosus]